MNRKLTIRVFQRNQNYQISSYLLRLIDLSNDKLKGLISMKINESHIHVKLIEQGIQ